MVVNIVTSKFHRPNDNFLPAAACRMMTGYYLKFIILK